MAQSNGFTGKLLRSLDPSLPRKCVLVTGDPTDETVDLADQLKRGVVAHALANGLHVEGVKLEDGRLFRVTEDGDVVEVARDDGSC